jgi:hypothetical protein
MRTSGAVCRSRSATSVPTEGLARVIRAAWSAKSSSGDDWSPARPSVGQCAVTALVVQDYLGGELLQSHVQGISHYWNRLPDGTEVDLTRDQFDRFVLDGPPQVRDREYVLSFPQTVVRYELLRSAADFALNTAEAENC